MPRGIPAFGFRNRRRTKAEMEAARAGMPILPPELRENRTLVNRAEFDRRIVTVQHEAANIEPAETDEQIEAKLAARFEILEMMTHAAIQGDVRALIVSGPPGLGKSYMVHETLANSPCSNDHSVVKGYVKATGLFKLLHRHRHAGQVLVFDDADEIFNDDTALTLLKTVCDSSKRRIVSYLSEAILIDEETSERIPKTFEFEGTIVFITNLDFDAIIERGGRLAPHLSALVSRAHYIDLAMKTKRDYLIRIRQVISQGLLNDIGLDEEGKNDVAEFIEEHKDRLRELSLRMALKVAHIRKGGSIHWRRFAVGTCCKNA